MLRLNLARCKTIAIWIIGVSMSVNAFASEKQLRTYLSFKLPIDPARIQTIADMDLSYALASTLVEYNKSNQIVAGLARSWTSPEKGVLRFQLRENLKWSNGDKLNSDEVEKSFQQVREHHEERLSAFFSMIESIKAPSESEIEFTLKSKDSMGTFLNKLTEPMYGVVNVTKDGDVDLKKSRGPYWLKKESEKELILMQNPNWHHSLKERADSIIVRKLRDDFEAEKLLLKDDWPNIMATHSILNQKLIDQYKENGMKLWSRNRDRTFFFSFLKNEASEEELKLFQYLKRYLRKETVTSGLSNFDITHNLFPKGIAVTETEAESESGEVSLPKEYQKRPLRILYAPERVPEVLKSNIESAIEEATQHSPEMIPVSINDLMEKAKTMEFDFYAGSVGVADSNYSGALAYMFQIDPPVIPSGEGQMNFRKRLHEVKALNSYGEKIHFMKEIMKDAQKNHYILPIFHFSTTVIAREGIDLSKVPETDEGMSFSKVRIQK